MYLTLICEILKELSVHVRDTFSGETAIKQTIKKRLQAALAEI